MEKNTITNNPEGSPHRGGDARRAKGVYYETKIQHHPVNLPPHTD